MTVLLVLFLSAALFLAGMPLLARLGWQPFGPLYQHELLRLSRRNSLTLWRAGLVGTQLLMMLLNYVFTFDGIPVQDLLFGTNDFIDPTASQQFAEAFLWKFLWVQQIAAIILTPIYLGGAIAEEKERKAWDFLLTSSLSSWELITGKFAARLTYVLSILAAGLPVLLLTLLFGGVNPERVLQGFLISGMTVVSLGVVSLWVGVHRNRLRDVLLWVFLGLMGTLLLQLACLCFAPNLLSMHPATVLGALLWSESPYEPQDAAWNVVALFTTIQLSLAVVFLLLSFLQVRQPQKTEKSRREVELPPMPEDVPVRVAEQEMPEWYRVRIREVALNDRNDYATGRRKFVPPITDQDDPLDWKERYFASQVGWLETKWLRTILLLVISFVAFLVCAGWFISIAHVLAISSMHDPALLVSLRIMGGITALVVVCMVPYLGLRTSMSIAEERTNQTLQELLMLPSERTAILWAKVRAPFWVMAIPLLCLAVGLLVAAFTSFATALMCLTLLVYTTMFCAFNVAFGLYLSTGIQSAVKAALLYLGVMLFIYLGPILLFGLKAEPGMANVSPLFTAIQFVQLMDNGKTIPFRFETVLAWHSLLYLTLAVFLGLAAKIRFEKEGRT